MNEYDPLIQKSEAIIIAGNASKLGRMLGMTRAAVCAWGEYLPPLHAYRFLRILELNKQKVGIEQATGGVVTLKELRPDIFGD